jgi:molecular chaperone HtpG
MLQNAVDAVAERRVYAEQHRDAQTELENNPDDPAVIIEVDETARTVCVSDRGIGMTATTVRDYFLKAGATFRRSDVWRAEFLDSSGASKVLRSGRFGVGALAAFLLGDKIEVTTRHANASSGITFSTTLLAEQIELGRADCPVGTSVLVHVTSRIIDLLRKANWDWFCLDQPMVARRWVNDGRQQQLQQRHKFAACGESLPPEWRRLPSNTFADVQWTYSEAPKVVCNGIEIRQLTEPLSLDEQIWRSIRRDPAWCAKLFRYPRLSVFDQNGAFPLTLTRDRVEASELPFDRELAVEVVRDFVAYCIAAAPEMPFVASGLSRDWRAFRILALHKSGEDALIASSRTGFKPRPVFSSATRFTFVRKASTRFFYIRFISVPKCRTGTIWSRMCRRCP